MNAKLERDATPADALSLAQSQSGNLKAKLNWIACGFRATEGKVKAQAATIATLEARDKQLSDWVKELCEEMRDRAIQVHLLAIEHGFASEGHQGSFRDCPSYSCIKVKQLLEGKTIAILTAKHNTPFCNRVEAK